MTNLHHASPNGQLNNAWVQLNRLRSVVGRYAANMVKWEIGRSSACLCGEIQTGDHVLKYYTIGPSCSLQNVEDPWLINYLTLCNFFVTDSPYSLSSTVLLLQYMLLLLIYMK